MQNGTLTLRLEAYDKEAQRHIASAQALADERKSPEVEPVHLFYRLLERSEPVQSAVRRAGVDPMDVLVETEIGLRKLPRVDGAVSYLSPRMLDLLARAEGEAARDRGLVSPLHLLIACGQEATGPVAQALKSVGLSGPVLRATAAGDIVGAASSPSGSTTPGGGATTSKGDPIEQWGRDLGRLAQSGKLDPVVGRDEELRRVIQVLARRTENNPLLVGEAGIGKRAVVTALALRIASGDVPTLLVGKRIVELDVGLLGAGAKLRSEAEERMRLLLAAVRDRAGEVILFVPDLAQLVGERASSGAAALFSSALGRGELRAIALTTPDGAKKAEEADPMLLRRFVGIAVEPPTPEDAIAIVRGIVERYERAHGVKISDPAITASVRLAKRYVPSAMLPKAAIDLIDEAAARVRVQMDGVPAELDAMMRRLESVDAQLRSLIDDVDAESKKANAKLEAEAAELRPKVESMRRAWSGARERIAGVRKLESDLVAARKTYDDATAAGDHSKAGELRFGTLPLLEKQLEEARGKDGGRDVPRDRVLESDVADVVAAWTGVPVSRMLQEETQKLIDMEARLAERVVGQDAAVLAVSKAVRRGRVGLRDPKRPIGSFLFLGPTGVGKTELAKALAEFLFDDEVSLTRIDMSEFMEKHSVARLLGSPPGYVDSEEGGFLTEAVRRRPYSVILFDEMEKAHPDVFNILLQVLDDGRLTDSRGRLAHFQDTVIIMTSNVGGSAILEHGEGVTREQIRETLEGELRRHFRPEFMNRIDEVVIFDPLGKKDLRGIVEIQLRGLGRMLVDRGVKIDVSDAAKNQIVELGYEPAFGARPVKRVILRTLQDPLAEAVLRGGYLPGDVVAVDLDAENKFTFTRQRPA